jgi:peptidoglycan/LPS O-acetylase OafA/YrhL/tetratricopeptide (TPR) repeat protein
MEGGRRESDGGGKNALPALTGLRFVAAFLVLFAHAAQSLMVIPEARFYQHVGSSVPFLGMTIFFVLSGFVIHYNYSRLFREHGTATAGSRFLAARVARLCPLFFFCLVLQLAVVPLASVFPERTYLLPYFASLTQSWAYLVVGQSQLLCTSFYPHAWSISTEVFFYLAFPLVVPVVTRLGGFRRTALAWVLFAIAVYLAMYHVYTTEGEDLRWLSVWGGMQPGPGDPFLGYLSYLNPLVRLPEFVLGCLTAQGYVTLASRPVGRLERVGGLALLYAAGAALVAVPITYVFACYLWPEWIPASISYVGFLNNNFLAAPAVAVFMFCAIRYPSRLTRPLNWGPVVTLGEASYSIYLLHPWTLEIFRATGQYPDTNLTVAEWGLRVGMACVCTMAVSLGTYAAIEVPGRRWVRAAISWAAGLRAPDSAVWRRRLVLAAAYVIPCGGFYAGTALFMKQAVPVCLYQGALEKARVGENAAAEELLDRAIELNPRYTNAYMQRAMVRVSRQDYVGAVWDLSRVLDLDVDSQTRALALANRANVRAQCGDVAGAIGDLSEAVAIDPNCAIAFYWRGGIALTQGRTEEAAVDFTSALEANPSFAIAHCQLAFIKRSSGDYDGAIAELDEALRKDPKLVPAYYDRGTLYQTRGQLALASADFAQVVRLDPNHTAARAALTSITGSKPR